MSNIVKLEDGSYLEVTQTVRHIQPTSKPSSGDAIDNKNFLVWVILLTTFGCLAFATMGND